MKYEDILKKAITKWGKPAQLMMVMEEISELQKALCKIYRDYNTETYSELIDEITDVEIMLDQLKIMFDCKLHVDTRKKFKVKRLAKLIE